MIYRNHEIYSVATKTHSSYKNSKFNGFIKLEPFLDECQGAALFWPSQISIDKMRRADSLLPFPDLGMLLRGNQDWQIQGEASPIEVYVLGILPRPI